MDLVIYTIGHSNIEPKVFIKHLKQYNIDLLVDVRSKPYSQYTTSFNKDDIERSCKADKIKYIFMGDSLGGKPNDNTIIRDGNKVIYDLLSEKPYFQLGINKLIEQANNHIVCVMCAEGQPDKCHRNLLITPALLQKGVQVQHILPDGTIINPEQLKQKINKGQTALF